ncbi:DUF4232 domain-containing protein [Streptomyces sp. NPDC046862]|uniref:DUF4232 domain-containing protein n=1 Tax=Streptomyces sp. NPDC046862 TaxID=3154603 RepID=UPI003454A8CF
MSPSPLILRRLLPAAALTCVAVLATGCSAGSAGSSSGGTPSATASGAPATKAPATKAPAVAATKAPAAAATVPASGGPATGSHSQPSGPARQHTAACPTSSLKVGPGVSEGSAGSSYLVIDFTNVSRTTCTLYGYPGVSFTGGSPVRQLGAAATRNATAPLALVTLAPGTTGNALLRITDAGNYSAAQCHPTAAQYLRVYPPNQTTPVDIAYNSTACTGKVDILSVSAVQQGSGSA